MERKIILSEEEILEICKKIGNQINKDYEGKIPVLIGVLKGALPFMFDLIKFINIPLIMDFIQVSSYDGLSTTNKIVVKKELTENILNKDIILIEDVIDTGLTMSYLIEHINNLYHPSSIKICSLFDKEFLRQKDVKIDYVGKILHENQFLMGYGLDYKELYRNVPYVYVPSEKEIENMEEQSKLL